MSALRDFLLEPASPPATELREGAPERRGATSPSPTAERRARARPRRRGRPAGSAVRERAPAMPPAVAVLCPGAQIGVLGAAVALLLARRARASAALVVTWTGCGAAAAAASSSIVARPAARRLAATLDARGLEATASGSVVVVRLDVDPTVAPAAAVRALAAASGVPTVLALGARDPAFDALLAEQDRLVVVTPPDGDATLRALALAGLARTGVEVRGCAASASLGARALARAGLAVAPSLRRALVEALDGLA